MDNTITTIQPEKATFPAERTSPRLIPQEFHESLPTDRAEFGVNGSVTNDQAMSVVLERAMERLRAVVNDAREQLGLPEGAVIDTSAEATAGRIADFALGAFERWHENHAELEGEDARKTFAAFIGGAISQGIEEARGILTALKALSPEVDSNISATYDIIQQRLHDFVVNGT